jgi:hypothetical protein
VNTRIRGASRRAGGRASSDPADESVDVRRRWRTTLAGVVVATMALGGITALAASPAIADDAVAGDQSTVTAAESTTTTAPAGDPADPAAQEPAVPPADPPADPPAEEPATPPADTPADTPAQEPAAPAEAAAPPAEVAPAESPAEPTAKSAADVQLLLVPPGEEVVEKVEICHRTDSYKNPYVINEPNANGDVDGHATEHVGPVFYPEIPKHTEWGDIIPPFYYGDPADPSYFPGLNWDADGQAIYENDCAVPTEVPELMITPQSCVEGGPNGQLDFTLGPLQPNVDYRVTVWDSSDTLVAQFGWSGVSGDVNGNAGLAPGDYTITVEQSIIADVWEQIDEQSFTIEECPPVMVIEVEAAATGCSLGDDGTALVSISGLVPGEEYSWLLSGDDYEASGVLDQVTSESLDVPFADLPPGNYFFYIRWQEGEEIIDAQATFFVEPCPPNIAVVVKECPAYGGEGGAVVKLSDLVEGLTYEVWVVDAHQNGVVYGDVKSVVGDATHMAEVDMSPLPAGKDYTAWVYAPWMPPGGISQWGDVNWFEVSASVDFSLKPCPAAPVTPVTPAGLAVTGTNDPGGLVTAALILLGLGGAALVGRGRRRAESRVTE